MTASAHEPPQLQMSIVGQVVMDALFPFARDHLAYPALLKEGLEPHKVKEALFFFSH